ncbi:MAG: DUF262 domain-containing protein, partial [Candidatus Lokiarchaeota archaeon]|nr:DUF262 domain-containing protein [Candidatus Lokiarchaeota archaeon]
MPILNEIQSRIPDCTYHVNIGLGGITEAIEQYNIDLNPKYQRGHVWTEDQESKFVGAILENSRAISPFWFNWLSIDHHRSHSEVVDGKQRIKSCIRWINGDIKAECPCGQSVHIDQLDVTDHRNIKINVVMDWNFVELDDIEVMKFYLR